MTAFSVMEMTPAAQGHAHPMREIPVRRQSAIPARKTLTVVLIRQERCVPMTETFVPMISVMGPVCVDTPITLRPVTTDFSVLKTTPAQAESARGPQRTVQEQATSVTTGSAMRHQTSASRSLRQMAQHVMTAFIVLRQMSVRVASVLAAMIPALTTQITVTV
jgi:hypothetical protein